MRACANLFILSLLAGCAASTSAHDVDDGGVCERVDRVCPGVAPRNGSPCAGELACDYAELSICGIPDARARCVEGRWSVPEFCLPGPVLAEGCRAPVASFTSGSTLRVVPPSAEIEWGTQGSAMASYRIAIEPRDEAPSCVTVRSRVELDGETVVLERSIRLRCGESERIQDILPGLPCEERVYPLSLEVEVEGLGAETFEIDLEGGPPSVGPPVCSY